MIDREYGEDLEPVDFQFPVLPWAGEEVQAVRKALGTTELPVSGVFPSWVGMRLIQMGYTLVEFVNRPSARAEGQFELRGLVEMRCDPPIHLEFWESPSN